MTTIQQKTRRIPRSVGGRRACGDNDPAETVLDSSSVTKRNGVGDRFGDNDLAENVLESSFVTNVTSNFLNGWGRRDVDGADRCRPAHRGAPREGPRELTRISGDIGDNGPIYPQLLLNSVTKSVTKRGDSGDSGDSPARGELGGAQPAPAARGRRAPTLCRRRLGHRPAPGGSRPMTTSPSETPPPPPGAARPSPRAAPPRAPRRLPTRTTPVTTTKGTAP
jgi:hypothetical protein